ncbi:Methyltransferase-like protein 4, partial [Stegodyphus mimosarum]
MKKFKRKKEVCSFTKIDSIIKEVTSSLIDAACKLHLLDCSEIDANDWFENNSRAREASKQIPEMSFQEDFIYHNSCNIPVIKVLGNNQYVLPPNSTFHLCDIRNISCLKGTQYDLVVLDPPWENKSVKRKKGYSMLSCESLQDLPIKEFLNPGCLIIVWVTNNEKQINFVKDELFQQWNVTSSAIWHWSKITQKGHFIHPINSHHKKPYENILLGRVAFDERNCSAYSFPVLKSNKVIVSVPSSIHSHKPPLMEILKPYIPKHPKCLELFARYLLPGWTSVGNEVLKLQ